MSMMKKILAVVATISMLATSIVAYAATPTVKTTLMTGEELQMYTGSTVGGGVKISFENFDSAKNLGGFVFSVMVPTDLKVMVNTGTQFMPNLTKQPVSESNIAAAVNSSITWTAIKLQETVGSFHKFGFTAGGQSFASSGEIILCFTTDAETYTLPEKAFEIPSMNINYSGESNPIDLTVSNYFDGDDEPTVSTDNDAAVEDANVAKKWTVSVDDGLVTKGDILVATFTNSNYEEGDEMHTQVVDLEVGYDVVGGAGLSFDLNVTFKEAAQRAATTLAIAKKAN